MDESSGASSEVGVADATAAMIHAVQFGGAMEFGGGIKAAAWRGRSGLGDGRCGVFFFFFLGGGRSVEMLIIFFW